MINLDYLKYLIKRDYKVIIILLLGIFLLFPLQIIIEDSYYAEVWYSTNENEYQIIGSILSYSSLCLTSSTIIIVILGIFTPLIMRHQYITKKQCDTYYALPIKKEKLYTTTYLFGFIVDISTWTLSFMIALLVYCIKGFPLYYGYLFLYMICMWGYLFIIYSLSSFLSLLTTNRSDANIITILGLLCFPMLAFEINCLVDLVFPLSISRYISPYIDCIFNPFNSGFEFTSILSKKAIIFSEDIIKSLPTTPEINTNFYYLTNSGSISLDTIIGFILYLVLCIGLQYCNMRIFTSIKAERIEYISPHQIGLKVCICILTIFILSLCDFYYPLSMIFIIANALLIYFIGQFYIKRKIKFDKQMFITLIPIIICGLIISL
ncbi:MAG: hypothetical protein ACI4U5_04355 [Bacilli bacterium]